MVQSIGERVSGIVSAGGQRVEGSDARAVNFAAGTTLFEVIRTTLGPRGMDKMLVSSTGNVVVTNDGGSIVDRMSIDHPTAKMIVDVGMKQDERSSDGTTTVIMLTGRLLQEAERLLAEGVHPTSVIRGYQRAAARAVEELQTATVSVEPEDRARLVEIAETSVTGRWDERSTRRFAELAVDAVQAVAADSVDVHDTVVLQAVVGGSVTDSELVDGIIIDMERSSTSVGTFDTGLPRRIENARIALVDDRMTIDRDDAVPRVRLDDPGERPAMLEVEAELYDEQVDHVTRSGADIVFSQKSIDDVLSHYFAREGILALERTRQDEMRKLARATGGRLVMSSAELSEADVGRAGLVERRRMAGTELTVVSECDETEQYSLLLRGGTAHVVEETKRIMEDCLDVVALAVREGSVVPGGGAAEVGLARAVRRDARHLDGKEQLAMEAFADALEVVPLTLARNSGLDPIDAILELRARHHRGDWTTGVDANAGQLSDMLASGVVEPVGVKRRAIESAEEVARMLIRIDDIIAAAPSDDEEHDHEHDDAVEGLHSGGREYPWMVGHAT